MAKFVYRGKSRLPMTSQGSPIASTEASSEPAATSQVVVERPPPGLAQGQYAWPAWGIATLGGGVALLGLVYFVSRVRARR